MERESLDIKSSRRRRTKVEALNSIQIASFLLFIGAKMQRRREAMRTEDLLAALNLQERRSGGAGRLFEWDLDRGRSSEAKCDKRMVSEVARSES